MLYEVVVKYKRGRTVYGKVLETEEEARAYAKYALDQANNSNGDLEVKSIELVKRKHLVIFNPHPEGKSVDDCVLRAFVKYTGEDYLETRKELNRIKKFLGANDWRRSDVVKYYAIRYLRLVEVTLNKEMSVREVLIQHPKGKLFLLTHNHIACVVDQIVYDSGSQIFHEVVSGKVKKLYLPRALITDWHRKEGKIYDRR